MLVDKIKRQKTIKSAVNKDILCNGGGYIYVLICNVHGRIGGQELAYQYAKEGACLALVARRVQALKAVAAAALERGAPDVLVFPADVSDPEQSRRAVEETVAHFGKRTCACMQLLSLLMNNAE
jgi:NAD(P)-dependent dehydrogenase (short-subunit alcohol dehydrogenase family)